jgi:hypothetical protein
MKKLRRRGSLVLVVLVLALPGSILADTFRLNFSAGVPETGALVLTGCGLIALAGLARKKISQ